MWPADHADPFDRHVLRGAPMSVAVTAIAAESPSRIEEYAPYIFLGILVTGSLTALDPSVYGPYHLPKHAFIIVAVGLACVLAAAWPRSGAGVRTISLIELLLVLRIGWAGLTNPEWIADSAGISFWLLVALSFVAVLVRRLRRAVGDAVDGTKAWSHILLLVLWINGVAQAVIGLMQAAIMGGFRNVTPLAKTPMSGTIGPVNGFGCFLAIGIVAAVALAALADDRVARRRRLGSAVVMGLALLGNGSRGAMLGLVVAGVCSLLVWLVAKGRLKPVAGRSILHRTYFAAAVILAASVMAVGIGTALYRMNPASASGRIMVWDIALEMATDHPLLGVGKDRFAAEYLEYQGRYLAHPEQAEKAYMAVDIKHAHSEYLQALCETGVVGALLFVFLWGAGVMMLLRRILLRQGLIEIDIALLAILIVILTHAAVDSVLYVPPVAVIAYLVLGLADRPAPNLQPTRVRPFGRTIPVLLAVTYAGAMLYVAGRHYAGHVAWQRGTEAVTGIAYLDDALALMPGHALVRRDLGKALISTGHYEEGLAHLAASRTRTDDRDLHLYMSEAYLALDRLEEAEAAAEAARYRFPDQLRPYLLLAKIAYQQGEFERAATYLKRCLRAETQIRSHAVEAVVREAQACWTTWFGSDQQHHL